jgi:hypothetical protein
MIWVNDKTGKFKKRPHYSPEELDVECEKLIYKFLKTLNGKIEFPFKTSELKLLLKSKSSAFVDSEDLLDEGKDVEGVTCFSKGTKPLVKISNRLQEKYLENRLRTTLTHELFHVCFHNVLYQVEEQPSLFGDDKSNKTHKCKRENILSTSNTDWMEWQAGYGCGAFLMPFNKLKEVVSEYKEIENIIFEDISMDSANAKDLISIVSSTFQTSTEAAKIRLLQRNFLNSNFNQNKLNKA